MSALFLLEICLKYNWLSKTMFPRYNSDMAEMRTIDEMLALREMFPPRLDHYIWVNYVDIEIIASVEGSNRPLFYILRTLEAGILWRRSVKTTGLLDIKMEKFAIQVNIVVQLDCVTINHSVPRLLCTTGLARETQTNGVSFARLTKQLLLSILNK